MKATSASPHACVHTDRGGTSPCMPTHENITHAHDTHEGVAHKDTTESLQSGGVEGCSRVPPGYASTKWPTRGCETQAHTHISICSLSWHRRVITLSAVSPFLWKHQASSGFLLLMIHSPMK